MSITFFELSHMTLDRLVCAAPRKTSAMTMLMKTARNDKDSSCNRATRK
jgi:hypothetical protein